MSDEFFCFSGLAFGAVAMSARSRSALGNLPRVARAVADRPASADVLLPSRADASLFFSGAYSPAAAEFLSRSAVATHSPVSASLRPKVIHQRLKDTGRGSLAKQLCTGDEP